MATKKRPRADLLSSLDAAFAASTQPAKSKYTAQAAEQAKPKANRQQAYQHSKRKRKGGKNGNNKHSGEQKKQEQPKEQMKEQKSVDPLYEKLSADVLAVGLKNCSLHEEVQTFNNPRTLNKALWSYMELLTDGSKAATASLDGLKNKVLSLDNPYKQSAANDAEKAIAAASRAQTAKLMGARRRRELGFHMLHGSMKYSDAEKLQEIWTGYVIQVIGSDVKEVEPVAEETQRARNAKLQAKLKYMDLSGCPLEVVYSHNPCNLGLRGIVVAETQQALQICCPPSPSGNTSDGLIRTLLKADSRFKVRLDATRSLVVDGSWLAARTQ